ncbi:hypothetical protein [Amphritea balenae]|nr:hypothetical protein [Amphritea balenae]GGK85345.1 hypothetical protein GCM10007941_39780 [Amphritea balenae]
MNNLDRKQSNLALIAQALYLINLLLLPGIALIALLMIYIKNRHSDDTLGRCHLYQSLVLSGWLLVLVVGGGVGLWLLVADDAAGISMTLLYLIVMHTSFVMLGILGLAKAISGQHFHPGSKGCPSNK